MNISIDLDEVLAGFMDAFLQYHNRELGTKLTRDEFRCYDLQKTLGGTLEEEIQKVYDFHKTPYFSNIKPIPGSQKATRELSRDHELTIVTARQNEIMKETLEWVEKHFPDTFQDMFFANHYSKKGKSKSKREICDEIGADMLIEDNHKYALECLNRNRRIILLNRPWNEDYHLPREIERVESWEEISKII